MVGGEPISAKIFETWADKLCLIEAYSLTECCIFSIAAVNVKASDSPTNIGQVTSGICWIVDTQDHNQLASIGSVGELLIKTPTLARGYLNEPIKTAAAFIKSPTWATPTASAPRRMYKTGNLVKYNLDGTMEFVGRKDTQVKLRGQRVELTLIEHHLRKILPELVHVAVEVITMVSDKVSFLEYVSLYLANRVLQYPGTIARRLSGI